MKKWIILYISIVLVSCNSKLNNNKYQHSIPLGNDAYNIKIQLDDKKRISVEDYQRKNHEMRIVYTNETTYSFRFNHNDVVIICNIENNTIKNFSVKKINGNESDYKIVRNVYDKDYKFTQFSGIEEMTGIGYTMKQVKGKLQLKMHKGDIRIKK